LPYHEQLRIGRLPGLAKRRGALGNDLLERERQLRYSALRKIQPLKDELQRENIELREQVAATRGGLAPWQAKRAKELLSANLNGRLSLTPLAGECGLSTRHFARAVRQSTGVPPHRWLFKHRVERARHLLPPGCSPGRWARAPAPGGGFNPVEALRNLHIFCAHFQTMDDRSCPS
jgi:AraC-like DNA-binding protein